MDANGPLTPGLDVAMKASRAWSIRGAAQSFKAVEEAANKVTLVGSMRSEVQRAFERRLPSATLVGGLGSASLAAAEWYKSQASVSAGLNSQVVDVAKELMSSATISGRLRAEAPKMTERWPSRTGIYDLYSPEEAARLAERFTFPGGSAARLAEKNFFGGPMATRALAEITDRQAGSLPTFSHRQTQQIAEQRLALMPRWSVAEMVKSNVGVNELAQLGVLRPGREPATTLRELADVPHHVPNAMK